MTVSEKGVVPTGWKHRTALQHQHPRPCGEPPLPVLLQQHPPTFSDTTGSCTGGGLGALTTAGAGSSSNCAHEAASAPSSGAARQRQQQHQKHWRLLSHNTQCIARLAHPLLSPVPCLPNAPLFFPALPQHTCQPCRPQSSSSLRLPLRLNLLLCLHCTHKGRRRRGGRSGRCHGRRPPRHGRARGRRRQRVCRDVKGDAVQGVHLLGGKLPAPGGVE